ncbi:MAG TPA: DUF3311 domain-containing protein [Xanthobacteraceae bacterium]|nr:DUF3311 domain-containing protein [Xanthobacteraceae bacterium]
MAESPTTSRHASRAWNLLFVLPFAALLWVPLYNSVEPSIWGIPFFYWYQFAWVLVTAGLTILVHRITDKIARTPPP